MKIRPSARNFHTVRLPATQNTHFRFQVTVNDFGPDENAQGIQDLAYKDAHKVGAKASESVLFDEFVKVDREHFKDDAEVIPENKGVLHPHDVVLVVRVVLIVKLDGSK